MTMLRIGLGLVAALNFLCISQIALAEGKPTRGTGIKPEVLYHNYCSVCHGDRGDGNSKAINSLYPPPKDFLQSNNLDRDYMIKIVKDGKPGTAMVGWGSQLNHQEAVEVVDYIRKTFMAAALNPKIQRGKVIYAEHCARCHGAKGEGILLPGMNVPPRNFASPQARDELYREKMIEAVQNGMSGTFMISFRDRLKKTEIEAVVDYIDAVLMVPASQISGTNAHGGRQQDADKSGKKPPADMSAPFPKELKGNAAKGKVFYLANCAECHGAKGDGLGKRAYFINPKPVSFVADRSRQTLNRPALFGFISMGKLGTEMPAWSKVISDQEIADVGEYVFNAYITPGTKKPAPVAKSGQ